MCMQVRFAGLMICLWASATPLHAVGLLRGECTLLHHRIEGICRELGQSGICMEFRAIRRAECDIDIASLGEDLSTSDKITYMAGFSAGLASSRDRRANATFSKSEVQRQKRHEKRIVLKNPKTCAPLTSPWNNSDPIGSWAGNPKANLQSRGGWRRLGDQICQGRCFNQVSGRCHKGCSDGVYDSNSHWLWREAAQTLNVIFALVHNSGSGVRPLCGALLHVQQCCDAKHNLKCMLQPSRSCLQGTNKFATRIPLSPKSSSQAIDQHVDSYTSPFRLRESWGAKKALTSVTRSAASQVKKTTTFAYDSARNHGAHLAAMVKKGVVSQVQVFALRLGIKIMVWVFGDVKNAVRTCKIYDSPLMFANTVVDLSRNDLTNLTGLGI